MGLSSSDFALIAASDFNTVNAVAVIASQFDFDAKKTKSYFSHLKEARKYIVLEKMEKKAFESAEDFTLRWSPEKERNYTISPFSAHIDECYDDAIKVIDSICDAMKKVKEGMSNE